MWKSHCCVRRFLCPVWRLFDFAKRQLLEDPFHSIFKATKDFSTHLKLFFSDAYFGENKIFTERTFSFWLQISQ
jgi:hypothetical protein